MIDIPVEIETPDRHYYHVRILFLHSNLIFLKAPIVKVIFSELKEILGFAICRLPFLPYGT